ncbi:MAG: polyribonucleotide nucleotidyltransferase [Spirochaetes bacterium GWF1_31_7]|nr:MAG: polyribonucleotide nucleotidyltransferase [Spirochaetes bacterium GWE1_32_154]OHD47945.1 MAG: polyribonucleotide nucleotidyltransferase [Spirochaetes bacterium GWE2_31_10]OHD49830.1 MAG: polyribonucleotide nucleotidyltransferase [Spirochaetes bacterium GWF1_31_7]OHD82234.1 MAG: polyribonucleotide nucleotidyltransferase [Spirochaetes bacterium RIFOXYB1_FULL_32_8]HBD92925.1 polyribonucleotide nucleotidyltransferase [Spirochaetia bacterium]
MRVINEKKIMIGGKELIIKTGEYAHQANGSVTLQCGETVIQAVVVMGPEKNDMDFFPLQVEYKENLYAAGKIKGSKFTKRPGRPTDESILKGRIIDRSIRPMFPKDFSREVQVVINVLAIDYHHPHDVLSLTAVVAALAISDIPFDCNLGGLRVSRVDGALVINPTLEQYAKQDFELVLAGNDKKIVMIESAGKFITDDDMLGAFKASFEPLGTIAKAMKEMEKDFGIKKVSYTDTPVNQAVIDKIKAVADEKIEFFFKGQADGSIYRKQFDVYVQEPVLALFTEEELESTYSKKDILTCIDYIFKKTVRKNLLVNKRRLDGRGITEVREIECQVGVLPRIHGSSMFLRGETQVLNILTLGAPGEEQLIENMEGEEKKRYIHAYSALPFSVGECGRMSGPGRREIGHGALAEKALEPVLPNAEQFPYVIRLVSEVMGQNGSSSMGSTCASSLALMDAGVPIKSHVAGISVGLITGETDDDFITMTDIQGQEDFSGDMDFKVTGNYDGITAIQMDTKIKGLTYAIIEKSIRQAHEARNTILDKMYAAIKEPRGDVSAFAPRIESLSIPSESIAAVIGSGGKVIKYLCAEYDVIINIEDDGSASIAGVNKEKLEEAKRVIKGIISDPVAGEIYEAKVVRIMDFGAFVEIFPGKEGLVHISKLSKERVNNVNDIVKVGQKVQVKLLEIDGQRRLNFSMNLDDEVIAASERRDVRTDSRRPFNNNRR